MTKIAAAARFLAGKGAELWLTPYMIGALTTLAASFALIAVVTSVRRGRWPLTRGTATDAAYVIFYLGSFYTFLIGAPIYRVAAALVTRFAPWLRMDLLVHANVYVHTIVLWLASDMIGYWWHRLAHRSSVLWEFHRVHHSQTQLTPLTNYRFHFVDLAVRTTLQMVPVMILGSPLTAWLAAAWFEIAIDSLAHADTAWSYGRLGWIFINPAFHRVHHSVDPRHLNRNFSLSFTMWDRIF